mgnify:CR=1 FL=1
MSSREKEICEKVIALVSEGETEEAISYLERQIKSTPDHDPKLFHDVVLLSNMHSNYERQKIRGTLDDAKGLNRITSEVLELTERIQKRGITAPPQAPPPGFNTSPDPLQPVYQQPVVQRTPTIEKKGLKSKVTTVMAVIGGIFVLLLLIGLFMEDEEPVITNYDPEPFIQPGPDQPGPAPAPVPEDPDPINSVSSQSASDIRVNMQRLFNSGVELDESDLADLDFKLVQRQLANTSWYNDATGYLTFDVNGVSGTYLNGNGILEISYGTIHGFWIGSYANILTGDTGYIGIVPPGQNQQMTIYSESENNPNISGFIEMQRR